jgi:hypothetical protein
MPAALPEVSSPSSISPYDSSRLKNPSVTTNLSVCLQVLWTFCLYWSVPHFTFTRAVLHTVAGQAVEVACYCGQHEYTNYPIESRLGSCQLLFTLCIVLFGQRRWDGPVPFRQSHTQEGSIQKNCEEMFALLLDETIYDQHNSTGTVVSQMNLVNGCHFFLKVHFNIVMSCNRPA